jgi:cellobiose-specific phosphotransferase system component IIC
MRRYLAATQQSLATLLPFVLVLTWLSLGQRLVLLPDGFFPTVLHYAKFVGKFVMLNGVITTALTMGFQLVGVLVVARTFMTLLKTLLSTEQLGILIALSALIVWHLLGNPQMINWLILPVFIMSLVWPIERVRAQWRFGIGIVMNAVYAGYILVVQHWWQFSLTAYLQQVVSGWFGDGPKQLWSSIAWYVMAVVGNGFGLNSLSTVVNPDISTTTANANLVAMLQHQQLPNLYSLYPLAPFALVGGAGMVLALFLAIMIQRRLNQVSITWLLVLIPLLLDQWWPFAFMLPIMWRPRLMGRMVLVTIVNLLFGALLLFRHLAPAVYWVPMGTPNLLLGGLASHQLGAYTIVMVAMLALDIWLYWQPAKRILEEVTHAQWA